MSTHDLGVWGTLILSACTLWFLLIMTVMVVALIQLLRQTYTPPPWQATGGPAAPQRSSHPESIVAERFARGEIDAETYTASIGLLRSDSEWARK